MGPLALGPWLEGAGRQCGGMSIEETIRSLIAEFRAVGDWETRYKMILARARKLAPMPEALKTESNQVRGCASMVWIHASCSDGVVTYTADSDALLVRGLVALILEVYSGHPASEILRSPPTFIEELGLKVNLSPNRANGLTAMVRQIMIYALAFNAQAGGPAAGAGGRAPPAAP